jgi:RIO kinase 1
MMLAREAIRCPAPLGFRSNVLVMSLIGDAANGEVSRQLKDATPRDPKRFSELILKDVTSLWKAGLVHGDLSAFNILNDNEAPVFIDFSQASPCGAPNAKQLLTRDLTNVANHFRKLGVEIDTEKEKEKILKR